jgi:hypothetical protein
MVALLSPFRETKKPRGTKGMKDRAKKDDRREEIKGLYTHAVPQHLP